MACYKNNVVPLKLNLSTVLVNSKNRSCYGGNCKQEYKFLAFLQQILRSIVLCCLALKE